MNGNKKYGEEITKKCDYDYPETLRFDLYFSGILREERISGVVCAGHWRTCLCQNTIYLKVFVKLAMDSLNGMDAQINPLWIYECSQPYP